MPQLDRFLSVMVSNKADALELIEGEMATLTLGGAPRPLTKQALTAPQLIKLVREIAPDDAGAALDAGNGATFRYETEDGVFVARVRQDKGKWAATLQVDTVGEFQRSTGAFTVIAEPPAPPPGANTFGRGVDTGATPRVSSLSERERVSHVEIDELLTMLVTKGASDLHLRVGEPPVLRLHGEMHRLDSRAPLENDPLESMLKSIMPERNRKEYAEINDTDFAYEIPGVARFRANAMRERKGAGAVFRVIPAQVVTVEQMGISQEVQNLCYLTKGLVLVTGPTGSGKSTTLCALMDLVNRSRSDHVITIEDPIEFVHQNKNCIITQRQVGVHTGSFKHALRAALREDPDIILVGEMRDLETVSIAIETAETGHLVFGTLHTSTAPSTIDRIIDQFPADRQDQIRVMLSESLKGVVSQTLCKKIGGGRVAAREILLSIPAISNLIREGKTFQIPSIIQTSKRLGMITLNDALIDLVDTKQVEPKEAYMKSMDKAGILNALKTHGHDTSFIDEGIAASEAKAAGIAGGPPAGAARPGGPPQRPVAPMKR